MSGAPMGLWQVPDGTWPKRLETQSAKTCSFVGPRNASPQKTHAFAMRASPSEGRRLGAPGAQLGPRLDDAQRQGADHDDPHDGTGHVREGHDAGDHRPARRRRWRRCSTGLAGPDRRLHRIPAFAAPEDLVD